MRCVDRLFELRDGVGIHAHLIDGAGKRRFIENTNNNFFAVRGGQDRDTQVDLFSQNANPEPAVLREAPLGNVQSGQNLDAGGDRQLQRFRRRLRRHQFAVDAVAKFERVVKWLDVNVRRLFFDCLGQN